VETSCHNTGSGCGSFATTQWSVVLAASTNPAAGNQALEQLCQTYWRPIYTYIRRRGHKLHEAQDLTQSFFAALLARNGLENIRPEQGRFRSFLVASVNNFLANEYDRVHAAKRGGGCIIVSLDEAEAEEGALSRLVSQDTPEKTLDRRWALAVLNRALLRLKKDFDLTGRQTLFEHLKHFLEREARPGAYTSLAAELGMSPGAVAVAVHRLRQRYRELVQREVAQTVAPGEVEDELRHLLAVLSD
jgi:RNA polymerase sigma factor (sigma-70 family)